MLKTTNGNRKRLILRIKIYKYNKIRDYPMFVVRQKSKNTVNIGLLNYRIFVRKEKRYRLLSKDSKGALTHCVAKHSNCIPLRVSPLMSRWM